MNLNSIVQQLQAQQQQQVSSGGVTANAVSANATNSSTSSQSAADSNATITANDFITLLVTELQNQDPTADTDPNTYVNQLINVNSLQQLISINEGVTSLGTIGSTSVDVLAAIDQNVSALDPSSTSGGAGSSTSNGAIAHAVSPAQMASAQAGYSAIASAPSSAAQGFDPTNPAASTQRAHSIPAVPSGWGVNTNALP